MQTIYILPSIGRNPKLILVLSTAMALTLSACERPSKPESDAPSIDLNVEFVAPVAKTKTIETARLGSAIDTFELAPNSENRSSVELAFAKLDSETAELKDRVVKTTGADRAEALAKQINLQSYRDAEMIRFTRARTAAAFEIEPPADSRSGAQKAEDAAIKVGEKVESGVKKIGNTLKKAADKTGDAIEDAVH